MGPAVARPEQTVTFEDPEAWRTTCRQGEVRHRADVLQLDDGVESSPASYSLRAWKPLDIRLRQDPFAKGGKRNAYHRVCQEDAGRGNESFGTLR